MAQDVSQTSFTAFFSNQFGESLGQSVVIANKLGEDALIGSEQIAKSAPDGHLLLADSFSIPCVSLWINRGLPHDLMNIHVKQSIGGFTLSPTDHFQSTLQMRSRIQGVARSQFS